jgi:hypothetical protein
MGGLLRGRDDFVLAGKLKRNFELKQFHKI